MKKLACLNLIISRVAYFYIIYLGKAHLLEDVISNIEMDPQYYQKAKLFYYMGTEHPLFTALSQL